MAKRSDFRIRDPYIVLHEDNYYMFGSGDETKLYYTSDDLENLEKGDLVFEITEDFRAYGDVWAGEARKWRGKFYLFVSPKDKHEKRGTQALVADTPRGPLAAPGRPPFSKRTSALWW